MIDRTADKAAAFDKIEQLFAIKSEVPTSLEILEIVKVFQMEEAPKPEHTIELVLRFKSNMDQGQLDDLLCNASEYLFSDLRDENLQDPSCPYGIYIPTGSHWRDISIDPAAADLPGGNRLNPYPNHATSHAIYGTISIPPGQDPRAYTTVHTDEILIQKVDTPTVRHHVYGTIEVPINENPFKYANEHINLIEIDEVEDPND